MYTLIDAFNQVELPFQTFYLPNSERREPGKNQERAADQCNSLQGMFFISCMDGGIML